MFEFINFFGNLELIAAFFKEKVDYADKKTIARNINLNNVKYESTWMEMCIS